MNRLIIADGVCNGVGAFCLTDDFQVGYFGTQFVHFVDHLLKQVCQDRVEIKLHFSSDTDIRVKPSEFGFSRGVNVIVNIQIATEMLSGLTQGRLQMVKVLTRL